MMGVWACQARSRACIPAWIHCASARSHMPSSLSTAGWILLLTQWLSLAGCVQMRRYAVLCGDIAVRSGPALDSPGFEFRSENFTNQVKTPATRRHRHRHHLLHALPRPRRCRRRLPPRRVPPPYRPRVACAEVLGPRCTMPWSSSKPPAHANEKSQRVEITWTWKQQTIDDLIDGRTEGGEHIGPLALWMITSMDARGHYGWLHPWTPQREGNNSMRYQDRWRRTFWTLPCTFGLLRPCLGPARSRRHMQTKKVSELK